MCVRRERLLRHGQRLARFPLAAGTRDARPIRRPLLLVAGLLHLLESGEQPLELLELAAVSEHRRQHERADGEGRRDSPNRRSGARANMLSASSHSPSDRKRVELAQEGQLPVAVADPARCASPSRTIVGRLRVAVQLAERVGEVVRGAQRGGRLVVLERGLQREPQQRDALLAAAARGRGGCPSW